MLTPIHLPRGSSADARALVAQRLAGDLAPWRPRGTRSVTTSAVIIFVSEAIGSTRVGSWRHSTRPVSMSNSSPERGGLLEADAHGVARLLEAHGERRGRGAAAGQRRRPGALQRRGHAGGGARRARRPSSLAAARRRPRAAAAASRHTSARSAGPRRLRRLRPPWNSEYGISACGGGPAARRARPARRTPAARRSARRSRVSTSGPSVEQDVDRRERHRADEHQRHRGHREPHVSAPTRLDLPASPLLAREQLDRQQPEHEAADVREVRDAAALARAVGEPEVAEQRLLGEPDDEDRSSPAAR